MKLSVVIVNYNFCEMLRHTLSSLIDAGKYIDYEVFIVDNASTDKSVEMLKNEFPQFHVIANNSNEGLARSYNKAISMAKGEYVLLVNPDIISSKKTLERALEFMDLHTDSGGLGVRMVTPQGRFLPESNRGLTSSWISFFKLIGLASTFPKSRLLDRNRKDWVEEFQTSEVDFLNGAFMLLRKAALDETGLFDEHFFMYGHDIDLSYRLRLAGYKNYYFPKTYIINAGDRSLPKFNWHFVKYFYGAMLIFAFKYLFKMPEIKVAGVPQPQLPLLYEVER
ncbi:Glycosyltransferase, GT2 family [Mucilaginibacter mallensis]|uniref:Glycosyltransferase, GT2 family n=2 Tax=Mucilaginibacter mallensis TaxID=652787 RepID=A0A1H1V3G1_MUCMA|nr:glycosyltransferase family 2 protein [Mucilaginibacter mallensis]SDS79233.1 Glycosyltransferase, GT2 family [Mucilaginibacter mallensis]